MGEMRVPFFSTATQNERYGTALRERMDQVVRLGTFILGNEVKAFETSLAAKMKARHAVGVANGSDALFLAVQALHLPPGSEVITTPFTFFASTACIVRNGLKPVFVDVDESTYHLDFGLAEKAVTKNTSAILTVDLFSHTCDNERARSFADSHGIRFIEDSAEAFGMGWKGNPAGSTADVAVLSFFPTKTLGCFGDGGAVLTNSAEIAAEIRMARVHGAAKKYHHSMIGINSRLDELQAAVLNEKLLHVDQEVEERARLVSWYREALSGISGIRFPRIPQGADPVWYVCSIVCERRDELAAWLADKGIGTSVYYPVPLHLQECFRDLGHRPGDFPKAEMLCKQSLALPLFVGMTEAQVAYVSDSIRAFYAR